MNGDFLEVLQQIAREKEISPEALLETVEAALVTAYKKNFTAVGGEVSVRMNTQQATFQVFCQRPVVEDEIEEPGQITLAEAREHDPQIQPGDVLEIDVTPRTFGRIAAQTAKQVVMQRLREAERDRIFDEYNERVGEVVTGIVQRREYRNVLIGMGRIEAVLPPQEQVETEPYRFNDRIKVYILEVRRTPRGPQVIVSRTHPGLIRRLFELEVPEIADGVVTIKAVAREPGARSKIAVASREERVDPVGSCVGPRGTRVQAVVNELYDEKIDIIKWVADVGPFIAEALSPAKASKVCLNEDTKSALVIVPDNQLSLAIGKSGQNVRLAARLTQWRIDIRSEAQIARQALVDAGEHGSDGDAVLSAAVVPLSPSAAALSSAVAALSPAVAASALADLSYVPGLEETADMVARPNAATEESFGPCIELSQTDASASLEDAAGAGDDAANGSGPTVSLEPIDTTAAVVAERPPDGAGPREDAEASAEAVAPEAPARAE
ncbi:MAG TPA: transcription termination factor NusA [Chthonomonadales bacterium]|nr:transcription termination factor NusA [Chthonomonadales bacterium]